MDKSTVLKSTISFVKNHNEVRVRSRAHDVQEDWKPTFLSNGKFTYLMLEALEGFILVFSATGQIYYVSESVSSLLGHNPADVINKSNFDLAFEEDRPNLYGLLQNPTKESERSFKICCELSVGETNLIKRTFYPTTKTLCLMAHNKNNIYWLYPGYYCGWRSYAFTSCMVVAGESTISQGCDVIALPFYEVSYEW